MGLRGVGEPTTGLGASVKWMMVTIIHLSPGSIKPAVQTIRTLLRRPYVRLEVTIALGRYVVTIPSRTWLDGPYVRIG